MGDPWTDREIQVALESYFLMLCLELEGGDYVKADYRRRAEQLIPDRSKKSIEFKWMNVSAILDEAQLPWIPGYKPAVNYQERLRELTGVWLLTHPYVRALLDESNG